MNLPKPPNDKITIAIDGYSSCGKSTLAKALAIKLGYLYIDTGAMYRSVTLYLLRNKIISPKVKKLNEELIEKELPNIDVSFRYNEHLKFSEAYLNNENVEKEIRRLDVSNIVSKVSAVKGVRHKMVLLQQQMGKQKGVVMDGRDIGTTVFPDAELKLFMTADENIRVDRRLFEYQSKGEHITEQEVRENLSKRDFEDINRRESPLIQAHDAVLLDNSDLDKQQQLDYVFTLIADMKL